MTKEQKERLNFLSNELNYNWNDDLYNEYCELNAILNEEYRRENEPKLIAFFEKYIKDKNLDDIDNECWDFYSDFHKDVYGFRPKQTQYYG